MNKNYHPSVQQVISEAENGGTGKGKVPQNLSSLINGIVQNTELYDTATLKSASRARLEELYRKFVLKKS